jgi:hypothetical protein
MNSLDIVPLGFRTWSLSPGLIFLPAFLPIKVVFEFSALLAVFCASPFEQYQGSFVEFFPVYEEFLALH